MRMRLAAVVLCCSLMAPMAVANDPVDFRAVALPADWTEQVVEHPQHVVNDIGARLNAGLKRVTVRKLSIHGLRADVNVVTAKNEEHATRVAEAIIKMRGSDFVRRVGSEVIEVANTNKVLVAAPILAWLGVEGGTRATYDVGASLGLVDPAKHDYMEANPVFQNLLAIDQDRDRAKAEAFVKEAVKDWVPGNALSLFTGPRLGESAAFTFEPKASSHGPTGAVTRWAFKDAKEQLSIRYVDVKGTVKTRARFEPEPVEGDPGSTQATKWWPADDPWIQAAARKLTADKTSVRDRVMAILAYAHRGMSYRGQVGSRYGVVRAMKQGYGHCWDKSDVFVTLCRAAGIPARQWAGWVPAMNSGHVWAEVYLEGEGWIPVDATAPWLGTSHHYVPLFMTDTGDMPIVHLRWPRIALRK